jgi:hypothetical protein
MDLAGDGQPDLVVLDGPTPGFYEHDEGASWNTFRAFVARLNRSTRDPNLRFVDLDRAARDATVSLAEKPYRFAEERDISVDFYDLAIGEEDIVEFDAEKGLLLRQRRSNLPAFLVSLEVLSCCTLMGRC